MCLAGFMILTSCCAKRNLAANANTSIGMDTVIAALKVQVDQANELFQHYADSVKSNEKLKLETAAVTLQTSSTNTASGSVTVLIFKPAYTNKIVRTSSLAFNLDTTPIPKAHFMEVKPLVKTNQTMANFIYNSAVEFYNLKMSPLPGLNKQSFDIDVIFSMENDYKGELIFTVLGAGVDASYEYDKAVQHEVKLNYRFAPKK
ncbi:MAG: hypothetical protein JST32_05600 [Bacteroidetes bacterium]|nr:hypothetical protein [Bacteroidota bacterium]